MIASHTNPSTANPTTARMAQITRSTITNTSMRSPYPRGAEPAQDSSAGFYVVVGPRARVDASFADAGGTRSVIQLAIEENDLPAP